MCGIVGEFHLRQKLNIDHIHKSISLIHHRGPDDKGYWINDTKNAYLGNVRLAIIDLSQNGHMPMHDNSGKVHLAYNGEIYNFREVKDLLMLKNYQFKSETDTEVILNAYLEWGESFVNKLNGMFSIAIYDQRSNSLYLYRDRAGEKPLYYYHSEDAFVFGSELRLLLSNDKIDKKLDKISLTQYLTYGYCNNDNTLVKGVKKLKAGSFLKLNVNDFNLITKKYWDLPQMNNSFDSVENLTEKLSELLNNSIRNQLISDVPIGILLSGGLDSSMVTAIAAANSPHKLKTFHVHFDGLKQYDEKKYADIVANHFDTEHFILSGSELDEDILNLVLNSIDEPMADSSLLPTYLVSKLTRQHVTVALGGDGCDELFGGYSNYQQLVDYKEPGLIGKSIFKSINYMLPIGLKGKQYSYAMSTDSVEKNITRSKFFNLSELTKILDNNILQSIIDIDPVFDDTLPGIDKIDQITRFDFKHFMCDDVLFKVDRMSMLNSLEVRAPWLDKEIIEFAFSEVPTFLKTTSTQKKILPKMVAEKILPKALDVNRKQGFSIPLGQWIAGKWKKYFIDIINEAPEDLFKKAVLLKMVENESSKYFNNSHRLFCIITLLVWMKKYDISYR